MVLRPQLVKISSCNEGCCNVHSIFLFLSLRKSEFVKENEENWRHTFKMLSGNTQPHVIHKVGKTLALDLFSVIYDRSL